MDKETIKKLKEQAEKANDPKLKAAIEKKLNDIKNGVIK